MADENFKVVFELDVSRAVASAVKLSGELATISKELGVLGERTTKTTGAQQQTAKATTQGAQATQQAAAATQQMTRANANLTQGLSTTRYAMYDMSRTLGVVGAAALGAATAIYAVSIAWERDFANVIRTSNLDPASDSIARMRREFIELQGVLPVTSSELAEIGTLAGQLGVPAQEMVEFTRIVAQFAATTDLSAEQAATAFGRLLALLPDMADGSYTLEQLASSILLVGTNSVATEGQITQIATQLSSMAGYAGLSADELVGLAGALASVGTQPELARGTITRLFTQMGKAVSEGGETLQGFAKTAGVSADQFASAFGQEGFGQILLQFINGLGHISRTGGDAVATLRDLGITSVRDVPALTRLATAADSVGNAGALINQTFGDANVGIRDGTELQKQYGVIAGTVAARIQVLVNNLQGFLATIGQGGGAFAPFIDFATELLRGLTELADNPTWNFIAQLGVILSGIVGVLLLLGAAAAAGFAGVIAMTQALVGLNASSTGATVSLTWLLAQMRATGPAGAIMAGAIRGVSVALGVMTGAMAAVGLAVLSDFLASTAREASGASISVQDLSERLAGLGDNVGLEELGRQGNFFSQWDDLPFDTIKENLKWLGTQGSGFSRDFAVGFASIDAQKINTNVKRMDEAFSEMVAAGNVEQAAERLREIQSLFGLTGADTQALFPRYLAEVARQAEIAGVSVDVFVGEMETALSASERLSFSLNLDPEAFSEFTKEAAKGLLTFGSVEGVLESVQKKQREWAESVARSTKSGKDSWEDYYDGVTVTFAQYMEELEKQVAAQRLFADNLAALVSRGAVDLATQLAGMGQEGATFAAEAVNQTDEELARLEGLLYERGLTGSSAFIEGLVRNKHLLSLALTQAGDEAVKEMAIAISKGEGAIQQVLNKWNLQTPLRVSVRLDYTPGRLLGVGEVQYRAMGGPVRGPGTGTSDSVPAMLSNGEYVIRASSVRQYGHGFLDAVNRGVAKFAQGGPVGGGAGTSAIGTGVMELGPKSLGRMGGGSPTVNVYLDDVAIAKAAQRGQRQLTYTGAQ